METLTDIEIAISSPMFAEGETIPAHYTCQGADVNPPLLIDNVPEATQSLAIIVEDPDAPNGTFDHWVAWNISPTTWEIKENVIPGVQGKNSFNKNGYSGPCPPEGEEHHYYFKIFALNEMLVLDQNSYKKELLQKMGGHVLAMGELMGRYKKVSKSVGQPVRK